jgi:hypothetical protein
MGCRLQADQDRVRLPPPGEGVGEWVDVIPIRTLCEVLFGYMLIIKNIDYESVDYSLIAFGCGRIQELSYVRLGKCHLSISVSA